MSDIISYVNGRIGSTYELAILRPSNSLGYNFTAGTLSINTSATSLDSANGARSYDALPTPGLFKTTQELAVAAQSITLLAMLLENGIVVATKTFTDPGDSSAVIIFDGYTGVSSMTGTSTAQVAATDSAWTEIASAGESALVQSPTRQPFYVIVAASQPAAGDPGIKVDDKMNFTFQIDRLNASLWARGDSGVVLLNAIT